MSPEPGNARWPALLLVASGAAALVYQLVWIKQLGLIVGVDVQAVTIAISAFFAGLALGGALLGRHADRVARPWRLYAALELGVGLLGVAATFVLANAAAPFVALEARAGLLAWALPYLVIGPPAFLMGGTLPVLVRTVAPRPDEVGGSSGALYAANTAGAIAGALLTPFALVPALGVRGAAGAAAAINLILALAAFGFDRAAPSLSSSPAPPATRPASGPPPRAQLAVILYAIAGGIALGYEVVWSQAIATLISTRTFAFAIVLATYLTGLGLGSALYARVADRGRDPWGVFGFLIAAAGLAALLSITAVGGWLLELQTQVGVAVLSATGNELVAMCARFAVAACAVVLAPTILLGAAFPAAVRLAVDAGHAGRGVGTVVALNTAGGIAGTLLTGFVLVPVFGLIRTLAALALGAALVGTVAVGASPSRQRGLRLATFAVVAGALLAVILTSPDHLATALTTARGGTLLFYDESPGGTVAVVEQRREPGSIRRLYIQGISNSGDAMTSLRYMRLQALLPLIVHRGEPRSALVIGLGTGITAGALSRVAGLERRVCAELLPAVVAAAPLFAGNFGAGSDLRLEIRVRDGRRELLRSDERYDLITLEPPPPSAAGVVNLYSRDFYELARTRLEPDGLLAQWWPLPTQNAEDSRSLVRSFLDAFPYATLWTTELHEMLLLGSMAPIELDAARIAARFAEPAVAAALTEVGIASPAALLATWITDRDGLERYAAGAAPVTDDRPRIEYASWLRRGEFARVLPEVLALRTDPPLQGTDEELRAALAEERRHLFGFYQAGLYAYGGEVERWRETIGRVLNAAPDNRYYNWVAGRNQPAGP